MLDWNKLKAYKTSKEKSFEQLCYQIAVRLFDTEDGRFTPIDDSGGGDGIEFYLTLKSGEEWGWQAKFYNESPARLNISNRKAGIIKSLKRAIQVHPNLKKWYLCLPLDFTPEENTWFLNTLPLHIPASVILELIPWGQSFIHEKMNQSRFNGLWQSFFNVLELNDNWFNNAFENSFTLVKNKFDKLLYTPNEYFEFYYLNPSLCNEGFFNRVKAYPDNINKLFDESLQKYADLDNVTVEYRPILNVYKSHLSKFNDLYVQTKAQLVQRLEYISPNHIHTLTTKDLDVLIGQLKTLLAEGKEETRLLIVELDQQEKSNQSKKERINQYHKIWAHESLCEEVIRELQYYIRDTCIPLKQRIRHFLGNGGAGKTNLSVAIAENYLERKLPVIFLPAIKLTGDYPIPEQILSILDIRSGYNFADFLDTLDTLGKIYNIRVPIILDGLNEAITNTGGLNPRLKLDLPSLENEINLRNNVILITTCRSSYQEAIWPGTSRITDKRFHLLDGFTSNEDKKRLVKKYFHHYKIQADLSFISLNQFSKPLYLKIFCETVNPERKEVKQVTLGHDSIYNIFEGFINVCNQKVYERLILWGKPPVNKYKNAVSSVLDKLGEFLWKNPTRAMLIQDLIEIADPEGVSDFNKSVAKALLEEELLFMSDFMDNGEYVFLTYDLMTGYFIGKYLVENILDFEEFFKGEGVRKITNPDYLYKHPNHEDIFKSICALIPIKKQLFVHDLIGDQPEEEKEIWFHWHQESVSTMVLLSPQYIPEKQRSYFSSLLTHQSDFSPILELCKEVLFVVDHPFNFKIFDELLLRLPMNIRDVTWTEYLRRQDDSFLIDLLDEFTSLQKLKEHTQTQKDKIELVVRYLIWNFTTTSEKIKDQVRAALYSYGKKYLDQFISHYFQSLEINDPSVAEWMTTICYNLVLHLTRVNSNGFLPLLTRVAAQFQETLFYYKSGKSTSHLSTRDYAFRTLELISKKDPSIITGDELALIKSGFKQLGIQNWETEIDKNKDDYRDGNSLIHYRFEKEKMYSISPTGDQYDPTPIYNERLGNLRWRAYNLGYDLLLFGEADKKIAKLQHYEDHYEAIHRYADKYIEIAYQELCGYLADMGKLRDFTSDGYMRLERPKFKPLKEEGTEPDDLTRFIDTDFIDEIMSVKEWCNYLEVPQFSKYLRIDNFFGNAADWILLHGLVHQCKQTHERQIFFYINPILVAKRNFKTVMKNFTLSSGLGNINSIPFTTHLHDDEVPDGDIVPLNQFTTWHYSTGEEQITRQYEKRFFYKDGMQLSEEEADAMCKVIRSKTGINNFQLEVQAGFNLPFTIYLLHGEPNPYLSLDEALEELGIQQEVKIIEKQEMQPNRKTIKVMHPVRNIMNNIYVSKNIIDNAGLRRTESSTDLLDKDGNVASVNHKIRMSHTDHEEFTYLRKDILDKYLLDNDLEMIFIFWGERDYYPIDGDWTKSRANMRGQKKLYAVQAYSRC